MTTTRKSAIAKSPLIEDELRAHEEKLNERETRILICMEENKAIKQEINQLEKKVKECESEY